MNDRQMAQHVEDTDALLNAIDDEAMEQRQREEMESPICSNCGSLYEHHREVSREDTYGNEHEGIACPPAEVRGSDDKLAHWILEGCEEYEPINACDCGCEEWYCGSCGADLSGGPTNA